MVIIEKCWYMQKKDFLVSRAKVASSRHSLRVKHSGDFVNADENLFERSWRHFVGQQKTDNLLVIKHTLKLIHVILTNQ